MIFVRSVDAAAQEKLSCIKSTMPQAAIAIVGMAFRFPGNVRDEPGMWRMLESGQNCITQVPATRWPVQELLHPDRNEPGRSVSFSAGILSDIDSFDAAFFNISPREAAWMDPQQRLLLEMAHEAMEDCGIPPKMLAGTRCGVYVGISSLDYGLYGLQDMASMSGHTMTGNTLSIAANRLSYFFDLRGPSMAVDTACSSSLVALHHACTALRCGEVDTALVGGVNVLMHPYSFVGFSKASMLSATGFCRPFDAAADGYVRAEGGAVLLLKPLYRALEDGDHIHAALLASGVNADGGRKLGLTIPSVEAQVELMREVLGRSGLCADEVDFIEAHGTGTPVGDPVEASAIAAVYGRGRRRPMPISSVKANVGHLESASGMAGLVKAVLSLKRHVLPPMALQYTPSPHIDFAGLHVGCAALGMPLRKRRARALVAGVNSFGFGGVNAHVLLQAVKPKPRRRKRVAVSLSPPPLLPLLLSARSDDALRALAASYAVRIQNSSLEDYYDVAYGAAFHRDRREKRLVVAEKSPVAVAAVLRAFAEGSAPAQALLEEATAEDEKGIVFVYTGNGAQWHGMGRTLLRQSPSFAAVVDALHNEMQPLLGFSLRDALLADNAESLDDTSVSQPLLFAIEVGVTVLLRELGLTPEAVLGHSVGEVTAAWAAGALSLAQAAQVICARSHAQALTRGTGRMAAVGMSAAAALQAIQQLGIAEHIEIAGINSPQDVTVSGDAAGLARLQAHVQPCNIFFRLLDIDYAFHSHTMDSIRPVLMEKLQYLKPSAATTALFVSTVTGGVLEGSALDSAYWWRNVRQPVLFSCAVEALVSSGFRIFVEVGPHAILQQYLRKSIAGVPGAGGAGGAGGAVDAGGAGDAGIKGRILSTLVRGDDGLERIVRLAARLHALTEKTDLRALFPQKGKRVALPLYPWQKERCWHPSTCECLPKRRRVHPLLGWELEGGDQAWENVLDPTVMPWLCDHRVGGALVFPAAGFVEMMLAAGRLWREGKECSLETLDITAPLVFDGSTTHSLRVYLDSRDGSLRIVARPRLSEGLWTPHATGRIITTLPRQPSPIMSVCGEAALRMEGAELYALALALGLEYGPVFRRIAYVNVVEGLLEAHLCSLDMSSEGFAVHPALLDASFHALVALHSLRKNVYQYGVALLPVKTGQVAIFSIEPVRTLRVQLVRQSARGVTAHCQLLDAAGAVVVSVSFCRFRAVRLVEQPKAKAGLWRAVAHVKPHGGRTSFLSWPSPSVDTMVSWLEAVLQQHADARQTWFRHSLPLLEALTLSFAVKAFSALAASVPSDGRKGLSPYVQWLARLLRQEGLLHEGAEGWTLVEQHDVPEPYELWQNLLHAHPEMLHSLLSVGRAGMRLESILCARGDACAVHAEICGAFVSKALRHADPVYAGMRCAVGEILQGLARSLSDRQGAHVMRVLELSVEGGVAAATVVHNLPADQYSLVLAWCDAEMLQVELARHAHAGAVSGMTLHAGDWSLEGGALGAHSFDVVIVEHVLHRATNVSKALADIRSWLAPGGVLLLAERHADWSVCMVDGLDENWWRRGQDIPLYGPEVWQQALEKTGFIQCSPFVEPVAGTLREGAYLLLAKAPAVTSEIVPEVVPEVANVRLLPDAHHWLFLVDAAAHAAALALQQNLEAQGQQVYMHGGMEDVAGSVLYAADNIVFMRGAQDGVDTVAGTLLQLVHCVCQVAVMRQKSPPRLWIVTHGGALCEVDAANIAPVPAQCALWGAGRVVMNEHPGMHCALVDVGGDVGVGVDTLPECTVTQLADELLFPDGHDEILLSAAGRHVLVLEEESVASADRRADRGAGVIPVDLANDTRCRLDFITPGQLRHLAWFTDSARQLGAKEVEARTVAAGLNFRDVMLTMGLLPDDAVEGGFAGPALGLEFSGIVTRVGAGVDHVKPGDAVVGFAPSCFASHVVTKAHAVCAIPSHWSHEAAATVPTVFFTAYYALKHLAQMQPGERLLVHGAAGGIGLASIQVARHLGLEVFATAGSEEKRDLLRLQGVPHVFDSRSLYFADEILASTQGEGVDVVLNSLAGEAMRRSLALLRPFGRFVELGKRDFVENTSVGVRPFKENISYFAIDVDQLLAVKPLHAGKVFQEMMELFRKGILAPLPRRCFAAAHVVDAFRAMQQSRHMGKIVLTFDGNAAALLRRVPGAWGAARAHALPLPWVTDGTWIISGGTGGLGLATALWLAERGAQHVVLVGRRGMAAPDVQNIIKDFSARGVAVSIEACDVTDGDAVHALVRRVQQALPPLPPLPPLRGLVHAAAVYDDRTLSQLDAHSVQRVLAPKLCGAWHLHEATKNAGLTHFVLYSSVSVALGNPGQLNYVAANAGLEGLTLLRRREGLPALCVAWGPVNDVGYLTRHDTVKQSLEQRSGVSALPCAEVLRQLGDLFAAEEQGVYIAASVEWGAVRRTVPHPHTTRYAQVLRGGEDLRPSHAADDIQALIEGKTAEEVMDMLCLRIATEVAQVLSLPVQRISKNSTLQALGMDSLMAVELAVGLEKRFGVRLPIMLLQDATTIERLGACIWDRLAREGNEAEEESTTAADLAQKHGEGVFADGLAPLRTPLSPTVRPSLLRGENA